MSAVRVTVSIQQQEPTNQNPLFRSRDWLSANQGAVFPDSVGFYLGRMVGRGQSARAQTGISGDNVPLEHREPPLSPTCNSCNIGEQGVNNEKKIRV